MTSSLAQFEAERHRRFGTTNPERMRIPHWEWMVLDGGDPYPVRQRMGAVEPRHGDPDWCFDRFGMSRTELGDGRVVCVGGEHEGSPALCTKVRAWTGLRSEEVPMTMRGRRNRDKPRAWVCRSPEAKACERGDAMESIVE